MKDRSDSQHREQQEKEKGGFGIGEQKLLNTN
jgi:hypothetical protein